MFTEKPIIRSLFTFNEDEYYSYYKDNKGEVIGVSKEIGELYTSLSLRSLIEAKAKKDTFKQYGDNLDIKTEISDENIYSYYSEGFVKYYFDGIRKISIETQPGTRFTIVKYQNNELTGSISKFLTVDIAEKYNLKDDDGKTNS